MPIGDLRRLTGDDATASTSDHVYSGTNIKGKKPAESVSSIDSSEKATKSRRRKGGTAADGPLWKRLLKHFKRFWICYAIAAIVFLAIFLPVFFLVIIPAIAQRIVDDYNVPIYSADITNPTPDSVTLSLATALGVPLGLSVRMDPFNLSLFTRDEGPEKPYIVLPVASYVIGKKTNITVTNQTTNIIDVEKFTRVLADAAYSKRFHLSLKGGTTAHLGALKTKLELNKDIELNGLDMLRGFSIDSAAIVLPAESDGTNLAGFATLPNYSIVTFGLGNVTLNLIAGGLNIGQGRLYNVVLRPGNNTVPLKATLDIPAALKNLGKILEAESMSMGQGNLAMSASGNTTIYNGQHIPYFENVLNNLTITAEVPIMSVLMGTLGKMFKPDGDLFRNITKNFINITLSD